MTIVSNTGPLIGLAKVDSLDLLRLFAATVLIPPQVHAELLAKTGPESPALLAALQEFIHVQTPPPVAGTVRLVLAPLDEGERQAIALALGIPQPVLLLLDDRAGRTAAKRLGQALTGLAGLLISAKARGFLPEVTPVIEALRSRGYWMSDALADAVRRRAGEQT